MRRIREPQAVRGSQPRITIGPLEKLVPEAGAPPRRLPRRIVDRSEPACPRVPAAHENRKRIVETERGQQGAAAARVQFAHGGKNRLRIADHRLMEDRGQRGARVLDVHVDVARPQRAVADQGAAEIQPAIDRHPALPLDRLRDELAENVLLGEILRADHDRRGRPAGDEPAQQQGDRHYRDGSARGAHGRLVPARQ